MKQRKPLKSRFLSLLIALVTVISNFSANVQTVYAEGKTYTISTVSELLTTIVLSANYSFEGDTIELNADFDLTQEIDGTTFFELLKRAGLDSATFNPDSDYPFKGTFNGNGHTITGLDYNSDLKIVKCSGLFGYTENATIKNITLDSADLDADRIGGIVAGYADSTTFENITVKNSHLRVSCIDNVLTLVTDGGVQGGAIVGYAKNCVLYNCESDDTYVNNNNTSGVQALGGKGLYVGGLVGRAVNATTIEYSRVYGGRLKNYYDVAVGALGGNTLYVGGIAGSIDDGSSIIDCFATNDLYFYCATYVAVGAGNTGHAGGIVGAIKDEDSTITRSHFAGTLSSRQYNAVLVIPIIQNNVNISGIADINKANAGNITDTYFRDDVGTTNALGDSTSTSEYGVQSSERYQSRDFWEGHDYDFVGDTARSSSYSDSHINKWVMDYDLGIPVHGKSVAAALDFEGAGTVTIAESNLVSSAVSTSNPYNFAVQGITFNESSVTLSAEANTGYKFESWYKKEDVTADSVTDYSYFTSIFDSNNPVSEDATYTPTVEDNDLYVARYLANVTFYELDGTNVANDNWYHYLDTLPEISPTQTPESTSATFIGWTTDKPYESITAAELATLKTNGQFYQAGDSITKTLDLYPVYADLIANVTTVFEGYGKDGLTGVDNTNTDATKRYANYGESSQQVIGKTSVYPGEDGIVTIEVTSTNSLVSFDSNCTSTANANATYRFIGWYEGEHLVSTSQKYKLTDVDLTTTHTYTARFEYRVDYYAKYINSNGTSYLKEGAKYTDVWNKYGETFEEIDAPGFWNNKLNYWTKDKDAKYQGTENAAGTIIYAPLVVWTNYDGAGTDTMSVTVISDFPYSGSYTVTGDETILTGKDGKIIAAPDDHYNFKFWSMESFQINDRKGTFTSEDKEWSRTEHTSYWYLFEAHVTADVIFHYYNGSTESSKTVERRYQDSVFSDGKTTYRYTYKKGGDEIGDSFTFTGAASPLSTETNRSGYYFIGWINVDALSDTEKAYVFKMNDDGTTYNYYEANSIEAAQPYILTSSDIVEEAMPNVYAVYAKYDRTYTTNITNVPSTANSVEDPKETAINYLKDDSDAYTGIATVTFTCNTITPVLVGTTEPLYKITKVTVTINGVEQSDALEADSSGVYTYNITAGNTYVFTAYYEPLIVTYHLNDDALESVVKYSGDSLGDAPSLPTYKLSTIDGTTGKTYIFVGWTETVPTGTGYHALDSYDNLSTVSLVSDTTIVTHSMDLYPVYAPATITVNSNIDTDSELLEYLEANSLTLNDIRSLDRTVVDKPSLTAHASEVTGFDFVGWYSGYTDLNNLGTAITTNSEYTLENDEPFKTVTYTAVYRKVYKINYYGTDGSIIYTAVVYEGDTRSFVETASANTGEDGSKNETAQTVPIDSEAFTGIMETLDSNVTFQSWQLVDTTTDGTTTTTSVSAWDTFSTSSVISLCEARSTRELNLYPITQTITVKNADNEDMTVTGDNPKVILGVKNDTIIAALNTDYTGNKITVHVQENAYTGADAYTTTNISNKSVTLYPTATTEGTAYGTKATDGNGDAIFEIGQLSFSKTVSGDFGESDREFNFTIQADDTIKNTVAKQSYTVVVSNTDETIASTTSTITFDENGSAEFKLKHGETVTVKYLPIEVGYTVTEDSYSLLGYSTSITVGTTTESTNTYKMTLNSSTSTIAFTNNRDNFIPTAIDIDNSSFNALISISLLGLIAILCRALWRQHHLRNFEDR